MTCGNALIVTSECSSECAEKPKWNFVENRHIFFHNNSFENIVYEIVAILGAMMCWCLHTTGNEWHFHCTCSSIFWYTGPVTYNISHPSLWSIVKGDVVSADASWYIALIARLMWPTWGPYGADNDLTLVVLNLFLGNLNILLYCPSFLNNQDKISTLSPSVWIGRSHLSYIINTMAADDLATQETKAWAAMILT